MEAAAPLIVNQLREDMEITVRQATKADAQIIARNVVSMAQDGSGVILSPEVVLQGVESLFEKPELGFYVVAEKESKIIGSLVIVFEWSDWRNGVYWWIHSVYVNPEDRRKGVYAKMYQYIKEKAQNDKNVKGLNLSVNKDNKTARSAYEKLGMIESKSVIYNAIDV